MICIRSRDYVCTYVQMYVASGLCCRDPVRIMQKKVRIACGTFIRTVDGMCNHSTADAHA